jgi:DNA transformation protein
MAVSEGFQNYVLEQLGELGGVKPRRMFGGVGLYHDALFFALIDDDVLYFKVGASNREDYVARGMKAFCPFPDQPEYAMGYYQVPADVLEEPSDLATWARRSCDVALAARESKPARKKKSARKKTKRAPKAAARKAKSPNAKGRKRKRRQGRKPSRR